MGRQLDGEVEHICPVLAKRAGADTFLAQEAGRALLEMVSNCSDSRTTTALLACADNTSRQVREKVQS